MATGYTSQIEIDTPFAQWAMLCARAFGATIMMRDDSLETPIPEKFEPYRKYHDDAIEKSQTRLAQLADMTDEQVAADLAKHNEGQQTHRERSVRESKVTRDKYERMLGLLYLWEPPTPDHVHMKDWMREQLTESIKWDCHDDAEFLDQCYPLFVGSPAEWREKQMAKEHEDIAYHRKNIAEEIERTNSRNAWVMALRDSL